MIDILPVVATLTTCAFTFRLQYIVLKPEGECTFKIVQWCMLNYSFTDPLTVSSDLSRFFFVETAFVCMELLSVLLASYNENKTKLY